MFYVYEWFIVETGEIIYVGKGTKSRYKVRKHNKFFDDMIRRFECSSRIVKTFEAEKDAFEYELERIEHLKSQGQCVCNISDGGYGGSSACWNSERRQRYSEYNVMKSEKQRARMSVNNPMKNKEVAEIVAQKHRRKICVEGKVYEGLCEVSGKYGVSSQLFLYWLERGYTNSLERCYYYGKEPKELVVLDHKSNKDRKPVIVDGVRYESIRMACQSIGCNGSYMSKALRKGKSVKGHICHYA